ncbi:FadR family transcriptional regulator [Microbacteriaceae bacterium VKM Ac-2855]|nr:FadR family transcriptional regulator [Microbacteriaceae bacterium VKM Ac-2855]
MTPPVSEAAPQRDDRPSFSASPRLPARKLGVAVVHDMVTAIVTGQFPEGSLLPIEAELTSHFGVSRTVIRESIKRIEEKGLIRVIQGIGMTVRSREGWNVLDPVVLEVMLENDASLGVLDDLAVVRSALEGAMAASSARIHTPTELHELQIALDRMGDSINDEAAFSDADMAFHLTVMASSRIALAESINRTLYSRARESSRFTLNATTDAFVATLHEHGKVLEAIRDRDPAAAEAAMRHHIVESWQRRRPPTRLNP